MKFSPIVLFVYNRLEHTKKTIEALQKNDLAKDSELFIFSDGFKGEGDKSEVNKVRFFLKSISGFKSVAIIKREENLGLARSIIEGVTEIVGKYGKIIVLEDDLVTSPYFLKYMNDSLEFYKDNNEVISIHGYVYPIKDKLPETFFIKGADCWGWATWKRGWDIFENDGKKLLRELKDKKLTKEFDFFGTYPYMRMLESQILRLNDSWAIRWYASAFLANKLTLYPGHSLIKNIGMDASGTHSGITNLYNVDLANNFIDIEKQEVKEDVQIKISFANYFRGLKENSIISKIKFIIKKFLLCLKK